MQMTFSPVAHSMKWDDLYAYNNIFVVYDDDDKWTSDSTLLFNGETNSSYDIFLKF